MLSYAQLFEDVYLQRCFKDKEKGFYIDLGACHPVHCNSTYHFYQRGWNGINVEPTPFRHNELKRARPRDITLGVAVGRENGKATFRLSANADHLSSLKPQEQSLIHSHAAHIENITVEVLTFATLCERHAPSSIDFLKIDVEGSEYDVLAGADWTRWRPAVVLAEATVPGTPTPAWDDWEPLLLRADYAFVFFDGVNRYYVAKERADLEVHFQAPVNPFDGAVALHSFGSPMDDRRHPDYAWARNFAERVFAAASTESAEHLLRIMTWDLLATELKSPATSQGVRLAFSRVLARDPDEAYMRHWEGQRGLTLRMLFQELLSSEEFLARRSRVSTRSMWR